MPRKQRSLASRLDTLVVVERPEFVPSPGGGYETIWHEYSQAWCSIRPATAANIERAVAETTQGRITTLVETRWIPGIELVMRLRWRDRWAAGASEAPEHIAEIRGFQNWAGASTVATILVEEVAP